MSNVFIPQPGCARCDYDNPGALVTCTTCSTVYCTLTESPNDIPCLRLAPGSDPNQFQCLECYHCLGPDQDEPWPHTFHSPRTRFNADSIDKCPEAEHTNCGGLAAHVVFEPDVKSIAVAFAQYLRGIWQGTGRALYVSCYECSNSSREVKICKVQTDQSSWSNEGRYCRVLVFYFASKSGLARDEILKMVARPREYFSVVTSPSTKPWTGFVLFAPGPVPDRKEFLNKLNQAAALDSYSFGRIAIYFTTTASASISLAFDPTILMVRACWGRSLGYYNSIIDGWMRDRSANEIVVFMAERGKLAQVCVYRDFEKHGWSLDVPLALCDCTNVVETIHTPKRWDFVETNHPGAVTTVTLQCSLCEAEKVFPKPDHVQSPNIQFGSYYSTFMADIGPTAGIADV
ncbi:unnamed protein product [Rhizoctonia solani]|uniref:Uncharacterized protein n=1 Tax=Rhizoctonia solani TaxID=456999 RepID=A0A8H3E3R8_9AGAM|nr:unnamed protein product [Rhizoctonia solani]